MITRQDLEAAIAECVGEREPNANTCIKLAAFYTIKRELFPDAAPEPHEALAQPQTYSYSAPPTTVHISSDSEFAQAVEGLPSEDVWGIVDELVEAVMVSQPALYRAVMRRLEEL